MGPHSLLGQPTSSKAYPAGSGDPNLHPNLPASALCSLSQNDGTAGLGTLVPRRCPLRTHVLLSAKPQAHLPLGGRVQPPRPGESFLLGNAPPFMRPTVGLSIDLRALGTYPYCLPAASLLLSHLTPCSQAGLSHSCFRDHLCHHCQADS